MLISTLFSKKELLYINRLVKSPRKKGKKYLNSGLDFLSEAMVGAEGLEPPTKTL